MKDDFVLVLVAEGRLIVYLLQQLYGLGFPGTVPGLFAALVGGRFIQVLFSVFYLFEWLIRLQFSSHAVKMSTFQPLFFLGRAAIRFAVRVRGFG